MKVNTEELNLQAYELRRVAARLNDLQNSVLHISRSLCRESVGERFYPALRSAAASIGNRSEDLKVMQRALQQIAQTYETTEMRITDEAEHATVHHEHNIIRPIPIPGLEDALRDGVTGSETENPNPTPRGTLREILESIMERGGPEDAVDNDPDWFRNFWNESRRNVADRIGHSRIPDNLNLEDALVYDMDWFWDFWRESRRNVADSIGRNRILDILNPEDAISSLGSEGGPSDIIGTGAIPRNARQIISQIEEAMSQWIPDRPSDTIGTGTVWDQVNEAVADVVESIPSIDWTPWNP